ncbi:IclR family transcriptional regulator [Amycolatopsis sp. NPDC051903]|uniref:IclR family transcriptional regulator n=1 Tax=Amycolatopsis sp. NPDC051903 TaxID=3363936 RepID=UPI0037991B7F
MARAVPALSRALDILEVFLDGGYHSLPEITRKLALPRTSAHELVNTLLERSYLMRAPEPGKYRLGVPLYQLGSVFSEQLDLAREGNEVITGVAARCGETVHLAVLEGHEVTYIGKVDSSHRLRLVSGVGRRLPAHCTGVGKMLLSNVDSTRLAELYGKRALPAMTANSITSLPELKRQLAEIRDTGLAIEYCESNEDAACVAAPVRDAGGTVVAAMSITVPTIRWSEEARAELAGFVRTGARELSARLGYREVPELAPAR